MSAIMRHPLVLFVMSFVVMAIGAYIGATVLRRRLKNIDGGRDGLDVVQAATLTLLALIIGFTFSMAVTRYDQRKNYEEEEANAIGTAYLRSGLLPAAEARSMKKLLRLYLDLRIRYYQARSDQAVAQINAATGQLQNDLWKAAQIAAMEQQTAVIALVVSGMNDVLNTQGYTQASWWNHIPITAWSLMIAIGLFSNLLIGYSLHGNVKGNVVLLVLPLVIASSFALIADIDSPRGGWITLTPINLIALAHSLGPAG
ncbi:hypothetical protein J8I87_13785 [Paraburkholderia sp. LEh10]|uniref:bestrophin-like domain n=1 Tax=Paraburkholderia sp. LEh10 TaxID=2821353 RepID=UPI001AE87B2C|nr:hypothetical protein [Paraburkholderia sp. LEh10]MBP0590766.1 hypothetical protein [Paraburkholderia sp. LEh10]